MKPDKNAVEVWRFRHLKAAEEFLAWLYRNLLKPGESARIFTNYPGHDTRPVVYVLGHRGAKIGKGRVATAQAAADAFAWAWALQEGNAAPARFALMDVLDGTPPHDIEGMTGLPPAHCEEIGRVHGELLRDYQSAWRAHIEKWRNLAPTEETE